MGNSAMVMKRQENGRGALQWWMARTRRVRHTQVMESSLPLSHSPQTPRACAGPSASSKEEFEAWFRLLESPGVGRRSASALIHHWGEIQKVWSATPAQWAQVIGPVAAQALGAAPEALFLQRQEAAWRWLQGQDECDLPAPRRAITWGAADYPDILTQLPDPPLMLYVAGSTAAWDRPSLAIVGSRNPTAQGVDHAKAFASALSRAGWGVISGLALGIDAAAHEGALEAQGPTVAVIGTGPDRVYPRRHHGLARRIVQSAGAVVSEYPPGSPVRPENFPLRNRIIAGLARGTLVVEAALESGSLITAKLALDAGREVFAIPGSIHSPQSKGCHALIRQGAKLVETAQDIVEEFAPDLWSTAALSAPPPPVDGRLQLMGHDPVALDTLAWRSGLDVGEVAAQLLEWELQGLVARLPGGLYQRRSAG